jgi:hypothetical protein
MVTHILSWYASSTVSPFDKTAILMDASSQWLANNPALVFPPYTSHTIFLIGLLS